MKDTVTLPGWLDRLIFEELGAKYCPMPDEVVTGADKGFEHVTKYLGTYFPRSYAESYCIFSKVFSSPFWKDRLNGILNIFDFCCGTGGEIIGLISAIYENLPNVNQINVDAHDANPWSIQKFVKIAERLPQNFPNIKINVNEISIFVSSELDMKDIINQTQQQHDIVLSFKAINEFVTRGIFTSGNPYNNLLSFLTSRLSHTGLLCLLDLTHRRNSIEPWYPIVMNEGINKFLHNNVKFKTIVPNSCFFFENGCNGCYMQDVFTISHSHKSDDISKVAYRIIASRDIAQLHMEGTVHSQCSCRATHPSADKHAPYVKF